MKWRNRMLSALLAGTLVAGGLPMGLGTVAVNAADTSFAGEEWYDQIDTVEINREPAHAYFTPYKTAEEALLNEKSALDDQDSSAYRISLNGDWKFKFAQKPADREKNLKGASAASYVEDWNTAGWDTIKVPSTIQALKNDDGTFKYEKPIYSNQRYPWRNYESVSLGANVVAPTVNNSVGQYKRTFTIPSDWDGRDVFVNFEGVESAFYLYVNGQRVGYAEDSYTTDEFNITSYLKAGENTIAAEVYRWSTGSFLENQDFIRYSGIFRDVNLYSKNPVEVRDVFIKTELDDAYKDATLTLDASVRNLSDASAAGKAYKVKADLYEIDGKTKVWDSPLEIAVTVPASKGSVEERADDEGVTVTGSKAVSNPKKWFADTPNLYMLLIELLDETGTPVETLCQRVGFREIGKADINAAGQEQAQINGKKIMFRGTNRHETDLTDGRALTKEDIKTDLFLMKEFNVNAIRTSHYPNNPYTYALADELGLYICDEANIESHEGATGSDIPSGFPVWNNAVMDRTKNLVERDKNHPCVVIWSLGNEATYKTYNMNSNYCFYNSTQWILQRDPSRLRKYERDNRYTKGSRENSMVDIYSTQYWDASGMESYASSTGNKAPYIQSEYNHAMGNSLSHFKEYWDVFRSYPNAQGGFIWDWIDQSMLTKADGSDDMYYGYGGDWGETVHDNDFCANGIINADRTPSPEVYEVKKVHQEVSFYDDGAAAEGKVRVVNEFLNTNLNKYNVSWTLKEDEKLIKNGSLTEEQKNMEPLSEKTITLDGFPTVQAVKGSDYVLSFSVTLKEDQAWAGEYGGHAGDEIAFEEFLLSYDKMARQPVLDADSMAAPQINETADSITITGKTAVTGGKDFEVVLNKATGYISSYSVGGKTLLENGPVPDYYRARSVNNDPDFSKLRDAADHFAIDAGGITVERQSKSVSIHVPGEITSVDSEQIIDYVIYGDGRIVVTNTFTPSSSTGDIAKIGMKMTVAKDYEKLTYYGRGPQENYVDRNTGSKLGIYESTVTDQFESKFVRPQVNGNHTGVRWTALRADDGTGILVSAANQMETSALHYKAEDLAVYRHPYQVPKQENTILTVALVSRGLGTAACGPGPLSEHIISTGKTYTHTFSITPITAKTDNQALMATSNIDVESGMPLAGIKINGKEMSSFAAYKTEYTYEYLANTMPSGMLPEVEAIKMSDAVQVEVKEGTNGDVTIHAVSPFGMDMTYIVHRKAVDQIYASDLDWEVDKGGYYANNRDHCSCGADMAVYVNGEVKKYDKGIGSHATAEVGINLGGISADRFIAQIGIGGACQSPTAPSNVNFIIKGDGKELFRQNAVLAGESYPVDISVKGVKHLSLIADANGADSNDHAVWADAKFTAGPRVKAESVTVEMPKTSLEEGEQVQANAVILPDNAYDLISWSSSNEKVATVESDGLVTAVAAGEADITATAKDGSFKKGSIHIKVTAKPIDDPTPDKPTPDQPIVNPPAPVVTELAAPTSVKAVSKAAGVTVSFAKVPNAASYDIYRKSGSSAAKKIANVTKASYVDTKAPGGKKSTYTVVAVSSSASYKNSAASKGASVTLPKAVSGLKAKAVKGGVKISFKKVSGAKDYTIYRANKKNGTYKKVTTTKKTSYTDKKAKKGQNFYKVVTRKGKTYSPASKVVSAKVKKK